MFRYILILKGNSTKGKQPMSFDPKPKTNDTNTHTYMYVVELHI